MQTRQIKLKMRTIQGSSRFIVPKDTDLMVAASKDDTSYEVVFTIGFLKKDVEKQKDDMEKILLQKFSEETVKEIMSVVRSKVKDTDVIEARYFYDKKQISICTCLSHADQSSTITLYIYRKGDKPF